MRERRRGRKKVRNGDVGRLGRVRGGELLDQGKQTVVGKAPDADDFQLDRHREEGKKNSSSKGSTVK